jgi:hypothetical protein
MMQTGARALIHIGLTGIFVIGSILAVQLYSAFGADENIWWTANTMPLKLDETGNSFELFIKGESLQSRISNGNLLISQENAAPVASSDITARINNWYKIKSSTLSYTLISSFLFGACLTMFTVGIIQNKKNKQAA